MAMLPCGAWQTATVWKDRGCEAFVVVPIHSVRLSGWQAGVRELCILQRQEATFRQGAFEGRA